MKKKKKAKKEKPQEVVAEPVVAEVAEPIGLQSSVRFFLLTLFSTLFIGVSHASELDAAISPSLGLSLGMLLVSYIFSSLISTKAKISFQTIRFTLAALASLYILSESYSLYQHATFSLVLLALGVLLVGVATIEIESITSLLLLMLLTVLSSLLLPVLGVWTQFPEFQWHAAVLGVVTGALLAASLVVKSAKLLEAKGFERLKIVKTKSGEGQTRPGALGKLFSLTFLFGPAVPLLLIPFGFLGVEFFAIGLVVACVPYLAKAFLEQTASDEHVEKLLHRLAFFSVLLIMSLGFFS